MQGWKEPSKEGTQEELAGREHLEMRGAECVCVWGEWRASCQTGAS